MKTNTPIKRILALFLACLLVSCYKQPDFYFLDGSGHTLADFEGQWLVINFWAEWCAPCRGEIPELNQVHKKGLTKNWRVVGVSFDPLKTGELLAIKQSWRIEYPIIATEPTPYLPFSLPKSLPSHYIISPNGKLVKKVYGEQTFESISKLLKNLEKSKNSME